MNKNYKRNERGRSMVEMLGVLAIVGVLSVGGLYGYGVAMKKHKANELLHQASMHAATVSAQIMSGKEPTDLTDFGTGNNITLDTDSIAGQTTFKLTISDIDSAICTQMKNSKGGMVRGVDCDEATGNATITYYKNLATNDEEGKNSPTGGNFDPACKNVTCDDGLKCFHGQCKCPTGDFICGEKCCPEGTYCGTLDEYYDYGYISSYICATPTGECKDNNDCDDDEYCYLYDGDSSGLYTPSMGECRTKPTLTNETLKLPKGDLTVYYHHTDDPYNWWTTQNICKAYGKTMVTSYDLGISGMNKGCGFGESCICLNDTNCNKTKEVLEKISNYEVLDNFWLGDKIDGGLAFYVYSSGISSNILGWDGMGREGPLCR